MAPRSKKDEPPISWGKKMLRASLRRQKDTPITIIEKDDPPSPSNAPSYPSIDRDSDPSFVPVPPSVDSSEDDEIADCPVLGFKEKVLTWNQVTLDRACHEESSNQESMIIVRQDTNTEESTERRHTSSENTQKKKRGEATKKQKPKRMCKFCQEWQTHLTRHIQRKHKEEEEVILATRLPGKERERAFASMRRGGIFKANAAARLADKDATLYRERCQGSAATVMCTGCLGFFDAKNVFRHKKICTREMSTQADTVKMTELSESSIALKVDKDFKCNVLDRLRNDPVGEICRNDLVTLLLGKKLWAKSIQKERSTVMAEMRLMGHLVFNLRNITDNESASGLDVLDFRQFDALETVIKNLAEKENGSEKTGLKVRIGYVLKKSVQAMKGYSVMKGNFQQETNLSRFIDVLNLNWNFMFYAAQVENEQRRGGLRKPSSMPEEEDVATLKNYLLVEMEKELSLYELWDTHSWVKMRNLVVSRLLMFNARRGGEPARLSLKEWREAITGAWIDPNLVETVSDPMEKYLIDKLKLAYQAGKGSRKLVPVLFPEDTIEPITKLLAERINCNVNEENPFLFPSTQKSLDHASGYHCLKAVVDSCPNLKQPGLLIADKFRHRVSTLFAQLDLPEEQRHLFYRHMGHSESINKNVYQCPLAINEITRVGDFLLNNVDRQSQKQSNPSQPAEGTSQSDELPMQVFDTSSGPSQNEEVLAGPSVETEKRPEIKGDSQVRRSRYTKWSVEDSNLVETHFKKFITDTSNKGGLPSKKEVLSFVSNHDILQGHNNKAELVRTKIFNQKVKYRNCFKKNSE